MKSGADKISASVECKEDTLEPEEGEISASAVCMEEEEVRSSVTVECTAD